MMNERVYLPEKDHPKVSAWPFIVQGLLYGLLMSIPIAISYFLIFKYAYEPTFILVFYLGAAIFFGGSMYLFTVFQSSKFIGTKEELYRSSNILLDTPGGHMVGMEKVGGWLFLTDYYLFFKSHAVNFHPHECAIPVSIITRVSKVNTFGVIPDGLKVELLGGQTERFVVYGRGPWIREITKAKDSVNEKLHNS